MSYLMKCYGTTLVIVALSVLCLTSCNPQETINSPIIVITIDTLRADHLGLYGYPRDTSPFLDEFAKESVVFEMVHTSMATTLPAHVSLWSSQYPLQTGVLANGKNFRRANNRKDFRFFAQILQDQGYSTAAVVSASPVKRRSGIAVGFDFFSEPEKEQRRADQAIGLALDWIGAERTDPFFLWVHLFDPHWPYDPPDPYGDRFSDDETLIEFLKQRRYPDPKSPAILRKNNLYDGEIRFVDSQIEKLVGGLKEIGLYEELTLVVTSDHGEGLGQHSRAYHGEVFGEQLRIPLIIKFPNSLGVESRRYTGLGSIIDIVPTLQGTLGLPLDEFEKQQFEGRNLLDSSFKREFLFAQRTSQSKRLKKIQQFALQDKDWKFVLATDGKEQLFHLKRDSAEHFDVINQYPEEADRLKNQLRGLLARYLRQEKGLKVLEETSETTLNELRSLGYLD